MNTLTNALVFKNAGIIQRRFRLLGNFSHGLHRLQRIFAGSSFSAQHNRIRTVKNSVGDVARLCARGTVAVNHAFKHLRGGNYRFGKPVAAADNILLHQRHNLGWDFHSQIAARYHNAVRNGDDFFNIFYTGMVFNFGDDAHLRATLLQNTADGQHVVRLLHKGRRHIIHAELSSKDNVADVLLR